MSLGIVMLILVVHGGCHVLHHDLCNHNFVAKTLAIKLGPYYHCPHCGQIMANENRHHHQCCYPQPTPPFFGYQATCWRVWPEGWIGCPEETIRTIEVLQSPTDQPPPDASVVPLPEAPAAPDASLPAARGIQEAAIEEPGSDVEAKADPSASQWTSVPAQPARPRPSPDQNMTGPANTDSNLPAAEMDPLPPEPVDQPKSPLKTRVSYTAARPAANWYQSSLSRDSSLARRLTQIHRSADRVVNRERLPSRPSAPAAAVAPPTAVVKDLDAKPVSGKESESSGESSSVRFRDSTETAVPPAEETVADQEVHPTQKPVVRFRTATRELPKSESAPTRHQPEGDEKPRLQPLRIRLARS